MAERVFFLNTLKPGVDPAAYEEWVQRVDYPVARAQPAIETYVVTRLEGHLAPETTDPLPCQYLEVIEVTSIAEYQGSLSGNRDLEALLEEWAEYVGECTAVWGHVIP